MTMVQEKVNSQMDVLYVTALNGLKNFTHQTASLGIVKRAQPLESQVFFDKFMNIPFQIIGVIRKHEALEDIKSLINDQLPVENIQKHSFYGTWVYDMAEVCQTFCTIQNAPTIGFCLGSKRGCSRYHVDNVPLRMLVTYAGKGTEWLPEEIADREAFLKGQPNEKILKALSKPQFMNPWDVAIFRGGPQGLLHRTPDAALQGPSVMLRLDSASFWENILKEQKG